MKPPISSRSRSGLAWARCSCRNSVGSILGPAVIAVPLFEWVVGDSSKNHAVTAPTSTTRPSPCRTPLCWTQLPLMTRQPGSSMRCGFGRCRCSVGDLGSQADGVGPVKPVTWQAVRQSRCRSWGRAGSCRAWFRCPDFLSQDTSVISWATRRSLRRRSNRARRLPPSGCPVHLSDVAARTVGRRVLIQVAVTRMHHLALACLAGDNALAPRCSCDPHSNLVGGACACGPPSVHNASLCAVCLHAVTGSAAAVLPRSKNADRQAHRTKTSLRLGRCRKAECLGPRLSH